MSTQGPTPSSEPARPRRRRGPGRPPIGSEDKRERILSEALRLFGRHGYHGASLADIAEAAEISKAGLLHHFASKSALYEAMLERCSEINQDCTSLGWRDDPWELLDSFVCLIESNQNRREGWAVYAATTMGALDADHPAHRWLTEHLEKIIEQFESTFERGKMTGLVRPEMPSRLVARTLAALSDGLQLQWLCATTPGSVAGELLQTGVVEEIRLYIEGLKALWRPVPSGDE